MIKYLTYAADTKFFTDLDPKDKTLITDLYLTPNSSFNNDEGITDEGMQALTKFIK